MLNSLAGLDIGTSATKVSLVSVQGEELGAGRAPMEWTQSTHGAEMAASSIVDSALSALERALAAVQGQRGDVRVVGIGVSSLAESGILVDRTDSPLAPVIAWHDTRDFAEFADLKSRIGAEEFSSRTGLPFRSQWSLTKHRWLRNNIPSVERAVARFNVAEWMVRSLGGVACTEYSLASRTGWLDLTTGAPWAEAFEWSGATGVGLGELVTAGTPLGRVANDHRLQPIRGAVLTVAGHDHQAAAVGVGAIDEGDELDSCGTAEALVRTVAPGLDASSIAYLARNGISVGWHAVKGKWCVLGGTQSGIALRQIRSYLNLDAADFDAMDRAAALTTSDGSSIEWREGGAFEVKGSTRAEDVWRAATRSITSPVRDLSEIMSRRLGRRRRLIVVGGWSNSASLLRAKSELLGPFGRSHVLEAGARGAAVLSGIACGVYSSLNEAPRASEDLYY